MDEQQEATQTSGTLTYYLVGAVVVALIAGGIYFLRPKSSAPVTPTATAVVPVVATPTPGPIVGLACERQWYNPVNFLPKYFMAVTGVDFMTTKKVTCDFTVSVAGSVIASSSAQSTLAEAADRGGGTFRCDSKELTLEANVPTVVDVTLKNDKNETATCTQTFVLPPP